MAAKHADPNGRMQHNDHVIWLSYVQVTPAKLVLIPSPYRRQHTGKRPRSRSKSIFTTCTNFLYLLRSQVSQVEVDRQCGTERIGFDLGSTSTRRERAVSIPRCQCRLPRRHSIHDMPDALPVLGIIDLMVVSSVFAPPSVIKFPEVKSIAFQKFCCILRELLSSMTDDCLISVGGTRCTGCCKASGTKHLSFEFASSEKVITWR